MATTTERHVVHSKRDGIEILTLRRPPANAMDIALLTELQNAFNSFARDDSTRAHAWTSAWVS
jgi:enoyl-CoA hydratase/carnithine racemase